MWKSEKRPEILAPVASWEMLRAAVHNGADAVYIGFPHFNARGRSHDFTAEELGAMIDYAHLYDVSVFLALNVLIFESELAKVEALLREILPLHPDALLVQDLGLARLIKKLAPDQAVHASTQMTVTSNEAIELTGDLDIERYVLGREVSLPEIERIRAVTEKELEVFVHGALCVSYSGQCLTSESHGGRSANRGQCAQSCRLPYQLIVDGKEHDLGDKRFLVSPQDLCGLGDVDRLIGAGVDSFKIEGRYKTPEYVASTVRNYREVSSEFARTGKMPDVSARERELGLTFMRGNFNGWFDGVNHQKLVDARFNRAQGYFIGEVSAVRNDCVEVVTRETFTAGDGIVFHDFEKENEIGGLVFACRPAGAGIMKLRLDREFNLARVYRGMAVYHNSSSQLDKRLRQSFELRENEKKFALSAVAEGKPGEALKVTFSDEAGHVVELESTAALAPAESRPLTEDFVRAELASLSHTPFELKSFVWKVKRPSFLHQREIKEIRRRAVEKITQLKTERPRLSLAKAPLFSAEIADHAAAAKPALSVLLRDESQVPAIDGFDLKTVYLDFEFNKDYERALKEVRARGIPCGIATTRILKPGELGHLKYIERLRPDFILVRNLGALHYFRSSGIPLIGDFSLNVANSLTARYLLEKNLARVTASYDLNLEQLLDLARNSPAGSIEVTVHQYMPAFHMEHCVFAAFLSNGTSFRDCGRPCEKHRVEVRDPNGVMHPLKPDAECRNTMFQGKPQSAARLIPDLAVSGISDFRIEALFETPDQLAQKIGRYLEVLRAKITPAELFAKLGIVERYGVTEGQFYNEQVYRDKKKHTSLEVLPDANAAMPDL